MSDTPLEVVSENRSFGGVQRVCSHRSKAVGCDMRFGLYLPAAALAGETCPVLYWLSGLTCTEQNFVTKAGVQAHAAEHGLIVVAPDTSPRGEGVADDGAYDLGQGAGFYINATQSPWASHYRMYDYVVNELPALVEPAVGASPARGIFGHSMGGHGALTIALKNPGRYRSVSAFSPIVAPSEVPWGHKAFAAYLGEDRQTWLAHDTCALVRSDLRERPTLLVDQGGGDNFLHEQLQPERLQAACEQTGHPLRLRMHDGYDHSYFFIASFMGDHVAHHARALKTS